MRVVKESRAPRAAAGTRPRALILATVGVAVLGVGLVAAGVAAALVAPATDTAAASNAAERAAAERATVQPEPAELPEADLATPDGAGISALAADWWVTETAARYGIPERALAAYAGAAMRVSSEHPECGLDWTTLAGIGHVESGHGTIDSGTIDGTGQQQPAIVGIALDGGDTHAIGDTDGGALDGDAVWDRAVGPMQLIPETWGQYASDGNDDGASDPQQIDDAALTAARYLCAVGVDLRTSDGWIAAISAYNDTVDYNNRVADATSYYRSSGT